MKHIEITELISAVPIKPAPMTRAQKLKHWAALVRNSHSVVRLFNGLEYLRPYDLTRIKLDHPQVAITALGVAAADPVFQAQGLNATTSIDGALRFFELSVHQAHAFSCDCGGAISQADQADRIERLA